MQRREEKDDNAKQIIYNDNTKVLKRIIYTRNKQFFVKLGCGNAPNRKLMYMLDSGAHDNLISWNVARSLPTEIDFGNRIVLSGLERGKVQTIGSIRIKLIIGELEFPTIFHVIRNLFAPAVLGAPFMKKHVQHIGDNFNYAVFCGNNQEKNSRMTGESRNFPVFREKDRDNAQQDEIDEEIGNWSNKDEEDLDLVENRNRVPTQGRQRTNKLSSLIKWGQVTGRVVRITENIVQAFSDVFFYRRR